MTRDELERRHAEIVARHGEWTYDIPRVLQAIGVGRAVSLSTRARTAPGTIPG
jgi:hypothetical protein